VLGLAMPAVLIVLTGLVPVAVPNLIVATLILWPTFIAIRAVRLLLTDAGALLGHRRRRRAFRTALAADPAGPEVP
jgi:hypothetical protein